MKAALTTILCMLLTFTAFCQEPKSIEEAVTMLLEKFSEEDQLNFKNQSEPDAVSELHMSVGMAIRNGWIRHGDPGLKAEFKNLGVGEPDGMSSIILTAAHRKLNNVPADIEGQSESYIENRKIFEEEGSQVVNAAESVYKKYVVGDKIKIYYPIIIKGGIRKAVNNKLLEWETIPDNYLVITGVITEKYHYDAANPFLELKIIEMNFPGISVTGKIVRIGEKHSFNLKWLKIEKAKKK